MGRLVRVSASPQPILSTLFLLPAGTLLFLLPLLATIPSIQGEKCGFSAADVQCKKRH